MKKKTRIYLISVILILFLLLAVDSSYSALSTTYRKIIRIAYMNGYIHALQLDTEEINELKKDKLKLKDLVNKSADEYIDKVYHMNR